MTLKVKHCGVVASIAVLLLVSINCPGGKPKEPLCCIDRPGNSYVCSTSDCPDGVVAAPKDPGYEQCSGEKPACGPIWRASLEKRHREITIQQSRSKTARDARALQSPCEALCKSSSPDCLYLTLPLSSSGGVKPAKGTRMLVSKILNQATSTIANTALLTWYGIKSSPCSRTDSAIAGNQIINLGLPCEVQFILGSNLGSGLAKISIPEELRVDIASGAVDRKYVGLIPSGTIAPALAFSDSQLNAEWGGVFTDAVLTPENSYLGIATATGRRCMAVSYAK